MSYRQGLFRIWLVFAILWDGYWGYLYISENKKLESLYKHVELISSEKQEIKKQLKNTPDSLYLVIGVLNNQLNDISKQIDGLFVDMEKPIKNIKNAELYGPAAPTALLIGYFVFGWIRKGFKQGY